MNLINGLIGGIAGDIGGALSGLGPNLGSVTGPLAAMNGGGNPLAALGTLTGVNQSPLTSLLSSLGPSGTGLGILGELVANGPETAAGVGSLATLAGLFGA